MDEDRMTSTDSTISYTPEDIRHCLQMFTCDNWGKISRTIALKADPHSHQARRHTKARSSLLLVSTSVNLIIRGLTLCSARHWHEICSCGFVVQRKFHRPFTGNDRAHNLHGERSARLSRSQSRYFEPYDRTPLSFTTRSISCVFLFNKPKAFFHQLCATWVDRTVFIEQWRELVKDVQEEWKSISFMVRRARTWQPYD